MLRRVDVLHGHGIALAEAIRQLGIRGHVPSEAQ